MSGNRTASMAMGSGSLGVSLNRGVNEQKAEHMLHLAAAP